MTAPVTVTLDVGGDLRADGRITRESAAVGEGQTGRLIFARLDAAGAPPGDFVTVPCGAAAGPCRAPARRGAGGRRHGAGARRGGPAGGAE